MRRKLLLADDSITIQRVIELTFADEDLEVIAVGDGQRAIERIEAEQPDIVLADVGMPERDGYEVAAFIKGSEHLAHIPVVLLTGAFEPIDEDRARLVGCDGVLIKPFEPQMVINRVRELLAGRTAAGQPPAPAAPAPADRLDLPPVDSARPEPEHGFAAILEPEPGATAQAESLDDYFDRLDAAFASLGSGPTPAGSVFNRLGEPDAAGPAADEEPRPTPVSRADASRSVSGPVAPESPAALRPVPRPPSLAEAFAALLAAEQEHPGFPVAPAAAPAPVVTEELVEALTNRVVARMTDQVVRSAVADVVLEVAERLVREEITRIKTAE